MKHMFRPALLAAACSSALVQAQVLPTAPGSGQPAAAPAATTSNNNYNVVPGSAADRQTDTATALGNMPMMDPGSENVAFNGKLWNVTNNRLMRSRFETYLTTPEAMSKEDQAYRDIIAQIQQLLAPTNKPAPDPMKAFALLPEAGTFKIDGGLCNAIANAIWDVWLAQKKQSNLRLANNAMLERRKTLSWNAEMGLNNNQLAPPGGSTNGSSSKGGAQGQQQANQNAITNSATVGRTSEYIKGIAEIEARMKLNETAAGLSEITSKTTFQALIIQMFLQRRFEHAVIACYFYPNLFKDGDSVLQLDKDSDVQKMLSSSFGVPPTISMITGLSLEAMRSVDESLVSFENLVARRDLDSATNRLLEAFGVGEYLPRVRRLPMTEKTKVLDFARKKNKLLGFLEMRDFAGAEQVVTDLRSLSDDFEYARPLAAINTAKSVSSLHISKARMAMATKDTKTLEAEMKAATEIWPTNPDLATFSGDLVKGSDMRAQALMEFDRLLSQRNYRQIFENQAQFIAAVADDPVRQAQLKKVGDEIGGIELIIRGANKLAAANPAAAWEEVERGYQTYPEDPLLNKQRADLGIKASEFVVAIENGREHEKRDQIGSAFSWYLKARSLYPRSEFALAGIKRLTDGIKSQRLNEPEQP
ncbi:MAG: hypothetical protein JNM65_05755 [Verrucomicrobiaceae bacterium]|nr:hypothetical protein [Verrucomicrobiaceae bacterium]